MSPRVAFLGDTLLGGVAQSVLDERGYPWAFEGIAPLLAEADLVVANHEGPITTLDRPQEKLDLGRKRYWYRALPASARALAEAGVGVVSLANNHVLDFGPDGLGDTLAALDAVGIAHCGAGPDLASARRPAIVDVAGLRIGFLSAMQRYRLYVQEGLYASDVCPGPLRLRVSRIREDLAGLRSQVDLTVALVHWGRNYRGVNGRQERLAQGLAGAGADLVVGHHPHIPQPVGVFGRTAVIFSLGNGPLGTPGRFHSGRPPYGLVAVAELDPDGVASLELHAIHVDNSRVGFRPMPAADHDANAFLRSLAGGCRRSRGPKGSLVVKPPNRGRARLA